MPGKILTDSYPRLLKRIRSEIDAARRAIDHARALAYWNTGRYINEDILKHQKRAGYGDELYNKLSRDLHVDVCTLQQAAKFNRELPIPSARSELTWTHFRTLITVDDPVLRARLLSKTRKKGLNTRQLAVEIKKSGFRVQGSGVSSRPLNPKPHTLTPKKGKFNIYQSIQPSSVPLNKGQILIDQGFNVKTRVSRGRLKAGRIVTARDKMPFTYRAYIEEIIDGDTLWVTVDLGLDNFVTQKLRLRGIDAPELKTPLGKKARAFVVKAFKGLEYITICSSKSDKYDRYLADIFYGKKEKFLNQELLDAGLAVLWA